MFMQRFWTCPACGAPCERKRPSEGWWTCAAGCPKNPVMGEHPKGAVDDWHPENSPGTVSVPLPESTRDGTLAFRYQGYLVWPADDRVYVAPESSGVLGLVSARQRTRGETNWDLPWDGAPPDVRDL